MRRRHLHEGENLKTKCLKTMAIDEECGTSLRKFTVGRHYIDHCTKGNIDVTNKKIIKVAESAFTLSTYCPEVHKFEDMYQTVAIPWVNSKKAKWCNCRLA